MEDSAIPHRRSLLWARAAHSQFAILTRTQLDREFSIGRFHVFGWAMLGIAAWLFNAATLPLMVLGPSRSPGIAALAPPGSGSAAGLAQGPQKPRPSAQPPALVVKELPKSILDKAAEGHAESLARIRDKVAGTRTAKEWRTLGLGLARARRWAESIETLRDGVRAYPALESDVTLLGVLRKAAQEPAHREATLELLASLKDSGSVDVVYDLWKSSLGRKERQPLAQSCKQRLESRGMRERASPALEVALDLEAAGRNCERLRAVLPRAVEHADKRSEALLRPLQVRKGCGGFFRRGDCFPCLRADDSLERAIRKAHSTLDPKFPE